MKQESKLARRLVAAVLALLLLFPGAAFAEAADLVARNTEPADGAQARLLRLVTETTAFARSFNPDPAILDGLADAKARVLAATPEEIEAYRRLEPQLERLRVTMARVRAIVHSAATQSLAPDSPGFPDADYPNVSWAFDLDEVGPGDSDGIPGSTGGADDGGLCTSARKTDGELFLLLNGTLVAEAIQMVASRICDEVIVVVGGGNLSLLCIITDLIYLAVRGAADNINLCEDSNDGAELHASYLRLGHLHTDLESAEANLTSAVAASETTIVNTVNDARVDIKATIATAVAGLEEVVNANAAAILASLDDSRDYFERIELEKALHSGKHYGVFYLPESQGGKLETARGITVDAITRVLASGDTVSSAVARLATGDERLAAGRYKDAWSSFAEAYFLAVRSLGEER